MDPSSQAGGVTPAPVPTDVNGGTVPAGVSAELRNEIQKIVMGVVNSVVPRTLEKSIEALAPKLLEKLTPEQQKPAQPDTDNAAGGQEKLTMKALQSQVETLQKALQQQQRAAQEADLRAKDTKQRSEVQAMLARHLGADSPHLKPYLATLYDVDKRFVDEGGRFGVKMRRDWGDEVVPLEQGMKELFDTELKHLIVQSKAQQLPPNGYTRNAYGQPVQQVQKPTNQRINPILGAIAEGISDSRPEAAQQIMNDAVKIDLPTPIK